MMMPYIIMVWLIENLLCIVLQFKELLDLGKTTITNQFGHEIPMYDLERTICDLVRSGRNLEIQDFNMAIKTYLQRSDKDLNCLMLYAKAFRIEKIIRQYMEVLL